MIKNRMLAELEIYKDNNEYLNDLLFQKDKEIERLNKTIKNQEFLLKSQGDELKEIYADIDKLNELKGDVKK